MKLILTRHGETVENQQDILQGHIPGKLSKEGIEQGKKLALRLKDEKIDVIYSSDLARASDTAKEIAKYHPNTPIHFVKELRATDLGSCTGKNINEVDWNKRPDDVETRDSIQRRVKRLLDDVSAKYPDGIIIFVGHNGINKALIRAILNKPANYRWESDNRRNTAVTIFEIKEGKEPVVHLMNCIRHLD